MGIFFGICIYCEIFLHIYSLLEFAGRGNLGLYFFGVWLGNRDMIISCSIKPKSKIVNYRFQN